MKLSNQVYSTFGETKQKLANEKHSHLKMAELMPFKNKKIIQPSMHTLAKVSPVCVCIYIIYIYIYTHNTFFSDSTNSTKLPLSSLRYIYVLSVSVRKDPTQIANTWVY